MMKEEIEFETVTLKVPKQVMEYLRKNLVNFANSTWTMNEYLESCIVDRVRADIDAEAFVPTPQETIEKFGLTPVFNAILGKE